MESPSFICVQSDVHSLPVSRCRHEGPFLSTVVVDTSTGAVVLFGRKQNGKNKSFAHKIYDVLDQLSQKQNKVFGAFNWLKTHYVAMFRLCLEYDEIITINTTVRKIVFKRSPNIVIKNLLGHKLTHYLVIVTDGHYWDFFADETAEAQLSSSPFNCTID